MIHTVVGGAQFSEDGRYRYLLTRQWDVTTEPRRCVFVMLNPSTADGYQDDPTIRRCMGFARREGCDELTVVNLYALRATRPVHLWEAADPVGPDNDRWLCDVTLEISYDDPTLVVAAWGVHAKPDRVKRALELIELPISCLGHTKDGSPRHPLYLPKDAPLVPYAPELGQR